MAEIYSREYQTKAHHLKVGILKGYPEPSVDDLDFGVGLRPDTIAFDRWRKRTGVRFVDVLKVRDEAPVAMTTPKDVDAALGKGSEIGEIAKWYITPAQFEAAYPAPAEPNFVRLRGRLIAIKDDGRVIVDGVEFMSVARIATKDAETIATLREENARCHEVIAEMTRTIAGLRGVPEAVEPGYGVENLAMMGRWGR